MSTPLKKVSAKPELLLSTQHHLCPGCGEPFTPLGGHWSGEQLDWQVIVRLAAHCRRRYKRACDCRVPATVTAPGPPKAVGKGLFTNAFIAMLLVERFTAGRSQNSLVKAFVDRKSVV